MPHCLQGWKCATVGKAVIALLASLAFASQESLCADHELKWVSPSHISTLDSYVAPQATEVDAALSDTIERGIRAGHKTTAKRDHRTRAQVREPSKTAPSWKAVGSPRSRSAGTFANQKQSESTNKPSPLGKWLTPEDVTVSIGDQEPTAPAAIATDDAPISVATDVPAGKPTRSVKQPQVASTPDAIRQPSERIALRFRRRQAQQPKQPYVPQATMHPTERQKDDRRRPTEPPAHNIPNPEREETESEAITGSDELAPLSNWQTRLRTKVRRVLAHYYSRPLSTHDRSPWEVMHSLLAFEVNSKVLRGGPRGEPITAVGWLCFNQPCKRRTLMYINDEEELRVRVGPALQGHRGQLLAMLAQSKVSPNYPMRVEGHDLTVADLIEMEKRTCFPRSELTFKLIGLTHYLPSDSRWMNDQGMEWNLRKLVSEELRQPIRGAACGGTHRLSGLTLAYKKREQRGEPVDGEYLRAKKFVAKYQQYAYRMQNPDGSFSTEWFRGPGNEESIDRKLKTTGHLLEWLLYTATEKELKYSRTTRAANYLANIMYNNRNKNWEAGPLGHAIHALLLYDRLVFSPHDDSDKAPLATKPQRSRTGRSRR